LNDDPYEQLAIALDRLPNGFPRTPSRTEIQLLKWIFSPDEALLAGKLTGKMESIDVIADRVDLDPGELNKKLKQMAKRELIEYDSEAKKPKYSWLPLLLASLKLRENKWIIHSLIFLINIWLMEVP